MNITKIVRTTVMAGLVLVSLAGLPQAVRAEEISAENGNTPTVTDDVVVDGRIITAENDDNDRADGDLTASDGDDAAAQTSQPDSEWKYVPVRRSVPITATFDGRLLTAKDLSAEQNSEAKPAQ